MRFFQFITAIVVSLFASTSLAAVTESGDVAPTPNATGGSIVGALTVGVGDTAGRTRVGLMTVTDGTSLISGDGIIGDRLGANGSVVVRDAGSEWSATDDMLVGNDGYGDLFLTDQGIASSGDDFSIGVLNDGRGWTSVNGSGTILDAGDVLTVGLEGTGNLNADDFARVVSESGIIASLANSTGFATIREGASWRNRNDLSVGAAGTGSLAVLGGGLVENGVGRITSGSSGNGQAIVSGRNSLWLNRDDLIVADQGPGELLIHDSGTVQVIDDLTVKRNGRIVMSEGRLFADSISNAGVIAGSGFVDGAVNNTSTGSIRADESTASLVFASSLTNAGSVDAIRGEVEFQAAVTSGETAGIFARDGILRFRSGLTNNGKLGFSAGESDVFGTVVNSATGVIQVDGEGVVTFYDSVMSSGTLTVGPEASAVFLGDFAVAANASVSLLGLAADPEPDDLPSFDPVNVAGQFEVEGRLEIVASQDPIEVTEPTSPGSSITLSLVTAKELLGSFDEVSYDLSTLSMDFLDGDGRSFRSYDDSGDQLGLFRLVNYSSSSLDVTNYLALPGDADGDQDVDFVDFLTIARNFGEAGDWLAGDFTGDGFVMFNDFLALANNFGNAVAAARIQAVPEPSSVSLAAIAAFFCAAFRRRRSA